MGMGEREGDILVAFVWIMGGGSAEDNRSLFVAVCIYLHTHRGREERAGLAVIEVVQVLLIELAETYLISC
jgi:hypothetical protein